MENLPDFDLSSCLSWWSLSVRPWIVSTKLCAFGSGVSDCKFTILLIFGIDPFLYTKNSRMRKQTNEKNTEECD